MYYSNKQINQLAITLLTGLSVENPTPDQYKAAESFIMMVILRSQEKNLVQEKLTETEWFCLNLVASGFSAEETAEKLSLTYNTVKNYRERIRQKLCCKTIAQAVFKAFVQYQL